MAYGPWSVRVAFAPGGGFAYRPGEVVVLEKQAEDAEAFLRELQRPVPLETIEGRLAALDRLLERVDEADPESARLQREAEELRRHEGAFEPVLESFVRFTSISNTLEAIEKLNQAGIYAQPNHVVFAHASADGGGVQANPFYANPFYANPFYANPFYANPFYANPFYANPFYANPFYANPFYANPFYANPNPALDPNYQQTGLRPSSARPGQSSDYPERLNDGPKSDDCEPKIAVLDTGHAGPQVPDVDREIADAGNKGYLDPVAGHGTFIVGLIRRLVPGCPVEVKRVIEPEGDGDEVEVAKALEDLAGRADDRRPDFVNLSFGGYSAIGMGVMAEAIADLHHKGTVVVASAGNDATGVPMYPAALPYVVAVGALDHEGKPAPFTNYGPWVRACTLGVEVVSEFFTFPGAHPSAANSDIDQFTGTAVWSGTSFAAPRVVAALAHHMGQTVIVERDEDGDLVENCIGALDAVAAVIDAPGGDRIPLLGKVVLPWTRPEPPTP